MLQYQRWAVETESICASTIYIKIKSLLTYCLVIYLFLSWFLVSHIFQMITEFHLIPPIYGCWVGDFSFLFHASGDCSDIPIFNPRLLNLCLLVLFFGQYNYSYIHCIHVFKNEYFFPLKISFCPLVFCIVLVIVPLFLYYSSLFYFCFLLVYCSSLFFKIKPYCNKCNLFFIPNINFQCYKFPSKYVSHIQQFLNALFSFILVKNMLKFPYSSIIYLNVI